MFPKRGIFVWAGKKKKIKTLKTEIYGISFFLNRMKLLYTLTIYIYLINYLLKR